MGIVLIGVVISIWYSFGIIRAIYWWGEAADLSPIPISLLTRVVLYACIIGMLVLGAFPGPAVHSTKVAIKSVTEPPSSATALAR